jgi:hypothetical protein
MLTRRVTRDYGWRTQIRTLLAKGKSLAEIAEVLNSKGVPPAHGTNRWTTAMVRKAYVSSCCHAASARSGRLELKMSGRCAAVHGTTTRADLSIEPGGRSIAVVARDGEPHARDGGSGDEAANAMKLLRQLIAGLAAITAFVYFAGGVVLGLRLAFARLPALGVVGQLPHDVLFAIGGSQVAIPALAFVAVHLAWRGTLAMQKNTDRPQRWHEVGRYRVPRARHVGFTAAMPVLLVLPGAALALASADDVPSQWPRLLVGVSLGGVLVGWGAVSWWSRLQETSDEVSTRWLRKKEGTDDSHVETEPKQRPADVALVFLGGAPFAIAGIAATLRTDDTRFLWLPAGWFVCLRAIPHTWSSCGTSAW